MRTMHDKEEKPARTDEREYIDVASDFSQPARIMIVDDSQGDLFLLEKTILRNYRYEVHSTSDPSQALALARELMPEAILLDVKMPVIDGFELCAQIRADVLLHEIPILFLTAMNEVEAKLQGFQAGGNDFLVKPVESEELLARISTQVRLRRATIALAEKNRLLEEKIAALETAHQALRKSEARNEAILDNAAVGMAVLDLEGRFLRVNGRFVSLFGYDREDLASMTCLDFYHPDQAVANVETMARLRRNEATSVHSDKLCIKKDGEEIWVGHWISALPDPEGNCAGFVCVLSDLSERKQFEEQLRKLSRAVEQSHNTIVITDLDATIEFVNPAFEISTGYSAAEAMGKNPSILNSGYLDAQYYKDLWATLTNGQVWRGEFLNRRKNGSLYWEQATISPIKDGKGRTTHYLAVKEDISERKKAEQELRLAQTVFDTSSEGILVSDADNRIITVNPAFTAITGYQRDEVLGRDPSILRSDRHDTRFYQRMWQGIMAENHWHGEIWNRRKDGGSYPQWLSIAVVRRQDGSISNYVAMFSDITVRKEAENVLLHQALHDPLTGLPNRIMFHQRLRADLSRARRQGSMVALLYVDLDGFKSINDSRGHLVGDQVLQTVADRLRGIIREEDVVVRLGGDEFAVILADVESRDQVCQAAERILAAIAGTERAAGVSCRLSASIGIALFPEHGNDPETLLRLADDAMYEAKRRGKSCYQLTRPPCLPGQAPDSRDDRP